jgi:tRNA nucleotidyltransferase (CCA-adding enzyme)
MIEPFLSAVPVLKMLEDAGFEAYFVGGAVRDFLLNKPIHDVDIATSATPEEMKRIFSKTIDLGIEHGTILVLHKKGSYEITTFRAESEYVDFRRPKEVVFIRSLKKDLERRDFTMNAIAMDLRGMIHDPFNGRSALKENRIVTVGKAEERFKEDALRMMRALRFVSQLSFHIETETLKALTNQGNLLENIAVERKRAEFEKLMTGTDRKQAIQLMIETSLYQYLPGLKNKEEALTQLLNYPCGHLELNQIWSLLLFCLQLDGKRAEAFLRSWRLPLKQIKEILFRLELLDKRLQHEWAVYDLYMANKEMIASVERLYNVITNQESDASVAYWQERYENLPIKNRTQLDVTGRDLMDWYGQKGGPWVSETLLKVELAILEGQIQNQKIKIKEWLLKCNQ